MADYSHRPVKARLKHGQFLDWIEREFAWSQQHASRFMHVHEQFKLRNLSNLEIDVSALFLIAAPSTPEQVRRVHGSSERRSGRSGKISTLAGQEGSCASRERSPRCSTPHQRQECIRHGRPPRWLFRIPDRIDAAAFRTSWSVGSRLLNRIRRNSNTAS